MTDAFRLDGRAAVVTGGGGRLGSAFATALAEAGAAVVVAGRDPSALAAVVSRLGEGAAAVPADVTDEDSVAALFAEVERLHGGLDILVNNAGIAIDAPFGEVTAADMERAFAVNVSGVVLCAQHAVRLMRPRHGGKIVNIGSIYGTVPPDARLYDGTDMVRASPPYVASKSALVNVTRDLAVRLAPSNIQVNMLSPGGVEADQPERFKERYVARTPAGRMAEPADVVGTLVYLSSPASDYVTGQNIHVDGGFTAW